MLSLPVRLAAFAKFAQADTQTLRAVAPFPALAGQAARPLPVIVVSPGRLLSRIKRQTSGPRNWQKGELCVWQTWNSSLSLSVWAPNWAPLLIFSARRRRPGGGRRGGGRRHRSHTQHREQQDDNRRPPRAPRRQAGGATKSTCDAAEF